MKKFLGIFFAVVLLFSITACNGLEKFHQYDAADIFKDIEKTVEQISASASIDENTTQYKEVFENFADTTSNSTTSISIPDFSGQEVITLNNDEPFFTEEEKVYNGTYIKLSELDTLGRCGVASACVGIETEPTVEREDISHVHPSGWNQMQLDNEKWLYNRSHLLMYALTGLNDDERNLITGTEHFNQELMLSYETNVKWVVDNYNAHVLYRVTPIYDNNNLVAKGVLMEAYCIEYPEECTFCVFVYNVEPGVNIDYSTGNAEII